MPNDNAAILSGFIHIDNTLIFRAAESKSKAFFFLNISAVNENIDKSKGYELMYNVINVIRSEIEKLGGSCVVKNEPFTMTKDEDGDDTVTDDNTSQDMDE